MIYRLKSKKYTLDCYVLCAAEMCGQKAFQASQHKNLRLEFLLQARDLRGLFIWFPEDRKTIVAAARKGVAKMREAYASTRHSSPTTSH